MDESAMEDNAATFYWNWDMDLNDRPGSGLNGRFRGFKVRLLWNALYGQLRVLLRYCVLGNFHLVYFQWFMQSICFHTVLILPPFLGLNYYVPHDSLIFVLLVLPYK